MKIVASLLLCCLTFSAFSQNGYIKLAGDSTMTGFLRYYRSPTGEQLIEFWRTKNDKSPVRIARKDIEEYAIARDTFRVLRNLQAIQSEDVFFDMVDAKIIESGRIQLLKFSNPYYRSNFVPGMPGAVAVDAISAAATVAVSLAYAGKLESIPEIFVLRDPRKDYLRAVPKKKELFDEVVADYFSDLARSSFEKENGKLTYRKLRKFVAYYNMKTSGKPGR